MSDHPTPATPATPDGDDEERPDIEVVADEEGGDDQSAITEPGKLLRIALMLREMQEEVRRADPDEAGRERLRQIHDTSVSEMRSVLSGGLQEELDALTLPFDAETPTESEIRIAQAQLIGWLEGLFQGIQAAIASQQMSARRQLEQMRGRGLPAPAMGDPRRGGEQPRGTGQYL